MEVVWLRRGCVAVGLDRSTTAFDAWPLQSTVLHSSVPFGSEIDKPLRLPFLPSPQSELSTTPATEEP